MPINKPWCCFQIITWLNFINAYSLRHWSILFSKRYPRWLLITITLMDLGSRITKLHIPVTPWYCLSFSKPKFIVGISAIGIIIPISFAKLVYIKSCGFRNTFGLHVDTALSCRVRDLCLSAYVIQFQPIRFSIMSKAHLYMGYWFVSVIIQTIIRYVFYIPVSLTFYLPPLLISFSRYTMHLWLQIYPCSTFIQKR